MTSKRYYLYRVEETTYSAGADECGDPLPGGPTYPNLLMIPVLGETPGGWWVPEDRGWVSGDKRWVSKRRSIPYACLTVEEAVEAWRQRCAYRIRLARKQIARLEEACARFDRTGSFYSDARKWIDPSKPYLLVTMGLL